jgi:hypothetical protein
MPSPDLPAPSAAPLTGLAGFGRPHAIPGEDTAGYEMLLARMSETVRPRDVIEEGFVRDVADLQWDILRNRRLKAALMRACAGEGLHRLLHSLDVPGNTMTLSQRWAARELEAAEQVDAILNLAGLGMDHVMAMTLRLRIGEIERIDGMIASAEARRAAALRDIGHYRATFAASVRRAVEAEDKISEPHVTPAVVELLLPLIERASAKASREAAERPA